MKKVLLGLLVVLAIGVNAQKFGVRAGLNLPSMTFKDSDGKTRMDDNRAMKLGFNIGATAEFEITEMFAFETGLGISSMGQKWADGDASMSINVYYIDIPLTGRANFDLGGIQAYGLFGPYVGVALSGSTSFDNGDDSESEDIEFDDDGMSRLDFGIEFGAGVMFGQIEVGIGYGLGLANIDGANSKGSVKNSVFQICVGYKFGG